MSSSDRGVSGTEADGMRSSALPSHPVEINDSDMDEASRSVSPEPLTQKKVAAKHEPSEGASHHTTPHTKPSSSSYPEGYSPDGIPPVLITDHVTSGEQAATSSVTSPSDSAAHPGSVSYDRYSSQQPSALSDTVPTATDKGFAEPPAINTTRDREAPQSGAAPVSPSKSPSFLSRMYNTFLGSSAEPAEPTAPRGYSNEAPSASWGRPSEPLPVEHIKEAGAVRAAESGLDQPTATKQAGLDAPSNDGGYQRSVPNTAVAAAEALVDDKASAQHGTAVVGQHAPHSPGRSESDYYGTPQTSPGDHTTTRSPGHDELPHGQAHTSSEARRELNLSAPSQGTQAHERHLQEPLGSSQQSPDRDMAFSESFQTARSHASEEPQTGSSGVIGSLLGAVGLSGTDQVEGHAATHTPPHTDSTSASSNSGVLGSLKAAVGLGDRDSTTGSPQRTGGTRYSSDRPAWASGGAAPVRADSPVRHANSSQEHSGSALTGTSTGTGYGSHNTGSLAETVKSYIPGTEANKESRFEQGHDSSYTGSGSQACGSGTANQGYSSGNQGYGSNTTSGTGSLAETVKSYIPGTEANKEARYEQGRDTGHDSSYTGSGNQTHGSGTANQGYGGNTGSGTQTMAETVKSYIPGTEANKEARYEQGRDTGHDSSYTGSGNQAYGSSTTNQGYSSGNQGYSSGNQGYSSGNTGSSTAGGLASYVPGTQANRESHAEHGQGPSTFSSGNNTGSNTGGVMSYIPGTQANRESRAEHGQDSNSYSSGADNTGVMSYIPGTQANRESRAEHGQGANTFSSGSNTGSNISSNTGGVMSYIPGTEANRESRVEHDQDASTHTVGSAAGMGSASQQSHVGMAKQGGTHGQSDAYNPLSSSQSRAPASASTGTGNSYASHGSGAAGQEGSYGQAHTASGLSQNAGTPQLSSGYGSSTAAGDAAEGTGHRVYGEESQGTGVLGKLKAAVGVGSGADTAPGAHSSWSTSQNPAFDCDTPRSGVGAPTAFTEAQPTGQRHTTLSNAPPSASWGSAAQTYAPMQAESGGEAGSQSSARLQDSAVRGSSTSEAGMGATHNNSVNTGGVSSSAGHKGLTTGLGSSTAHTSSDSHLPEKAATAGGKQDSSLVSGSAGGIGKDSAVKESTSAGQGTGLASKDSPKAVSGIRGKTPVEQSSGAFIEDTTADSSAAQAGSQPGMGKEPLKLGTTAAQHASTRNAVSGSPTGINSPSAALAGTGGAAGPSGGQAGPRLGTTAFEHALSRTSGKPLNRASGTPGSPPSSFKGPSAGATDPASGGLQGTGRTTSELPVSTNAPPASARSTQDHPTEAGTTAAPGASQAATQPKSIAEEPVANKPAAQKPSTGTTVGNDTKLAEPAGPQGAVGTTGTTGTTGAPTPAKNTNGAAKPVSKSKKGCFACFGGNSTQE